MRAYWAWTGPINGVRTGLANPKKSTAPLRPKRVDKASSGTFLKPSSGRFQLLAIQTLSLPSMATPQGPMMLSEKYRKFR
ncbi:MAG: hypothetical protein PVJ44_06865 [Desulfobacterales bacterium]